MGASIQRTGVGSRANGRERTAHGRERADVGENRRHTSAPGLVFEFPDAAKPQDYCPADPRGGGGGAGALSRARPAAADPRPTREAT